VCVRLTSCWSGGAKRKTPECPYSQPHGSMGVPTVREIIQSDRHLLISILGTHQRTFIALNSYADLILKELLARWRPYSQVPPHRQYLSGKHRRCLLILRLCLISSCATHRCQQSSTAPLLLNLPAVIGAQRRIFADDLIYP